MQDMRESAEEHGGRVEVELGDCDRFETESDADTRRKILSEAEETHG